MSFTGWRVEWNGCGETWPQEEPNGCWAQSAGGYGDGVGTGATRGHWIIEDSSFLFNTSDGLDLLYVVPGGSIELRRVIASGNAGNQIKTAGPATIENSVIVGNCGWFDGNPVTHDVDNCRAGGNALAVFLHRGTQATVVNNTIASEGDCVVIAGCRDDDGCDGTEKVTLRNNIHLGTTEFLDATDLSCMMYWEGIADTAVDSDYAIVHGAKHDGCPGAHDLCDVDPMVVNPAIDAFDGRPRIYSPAIGSALKDVAPTVDVTGRPRDFAPDRGAYEYRLIPNRPRPVRKGR